jgi:putative hydrolase of the HAD superfamily
VENATFEQLEALLPRPIGRESLKSEWLASPAVRAFELGQSSPAEFADAFVREWRLDIGPADFIARFATWPRGLFPGAGELLARMRPFRLIACLSNSNAIHWPRLAAVTGLFDVALASHLLGHAKPDATCFVRALERCDAEPDDVAFFDDSLANVDAARALGIRAFAVDGFGALERVLRAEGWA